MKSKKINLSKNEADTHRQRQKSNGKSSQYNNLHKNYSTSPNPKQSGDRPKPINSTAGNKGGN